MSTSMSRQTLKSALIGCTLLALSAGPSALAAVENVDLKLVLATDVSRSIDNEEAILQREGTAEAFASPEVIQAIQSGALGRIAVAMIDFSSPEYDRVVIDWQIIQDEASAKAFAERVRKSPRTPGRRTSISSALELGTLLIEGSEKDIVATRKVIDVSGDGPNNDGVSMQQVHDATKNNGIMVNGLPIMDEGAEGYFPDLDKYYAACVAGGRGSFVLVAHSFRDFGAAMRHKLILEVSGIAPASKFVKIAPAGKPLLTKAAATGVPNEPQVIRPGQNEFSEHCDITGGFGRFNRF
jgi:hypothetical protein